MRRCSMHVRLSEKHGLGLEQVVTNIVGHVDTAWNTTKGLVLIPEGRSSPVVRTL